MSAKRILLYVLVPIIYIVMISTFLYLHFTRTDTLIEKAGNLEIESIRRVGLFGGEKEIKEVAIRYSGTVFPFSQETPLKLEIPGEPESSLDIVDYSLYPDGAEVRFTAGVRLEFEIGGSLGSRLDVRLTAPKASVLSVPVSFGSAELEVGEGVPLAVVRNSFGNYLIILPADSRIDGATGAIRAAVDPASPDLARVSFERSEEPIGSLHLLWYAREGALAGQETYAQELLSYLEKAYAGWDSLRYVRGTGTWSEKNADPRFSEELGRAWIAEALKRGDFRKATAFFAAAQEIYLRETPEQLLSYMTSPYIGGLAAFRLAHIDESLNRAKQAEDLIRASDPRVFLQDGLIVTLLDQKKMSTIDDLVSQLVVPMDLSKPDLDLALGMMETYLEVQRWYPEKAVYFSRFRAVVEEKILSHLKAAGSAIYLVEGEQADLERSVRAGQLLQRLGRLERNEQLSALGRSVVLSGLAYADEQGFLPRTIQPVPQAQIVSEEFISPESIYLYLDEWPYLPAERPLYPQLDPGVWMWSAAELLDFAAIGERYRMSLEFPPGETHYVLIQGAAVPASVQFQGAALDAVEELSNVSTGWLWNGETRSLSLKLQQELGVAELIIDFQP